MWIFLEFVYSTFRHMTAAAAMWLFCSLSHSNEENAACLHGSI